MKLAEDFPSRPGYGTKGTKVELSANYIELLPPSDLVLYRYDIHINPAAAGKKHFRIVQLLLQSPELAAHQGEIATDFRSTLFSKTRFHRDENLIEVRYRLEGEDEPSARATTYNVHVLYTKTLVMDELINYLNSTNLGHSLRDKQELTQALNIFLNHYARSAKNIVTVGSTKSFSLSSNTAKRDIGSDLDVIRGFFSSVRTATCRILININVSHGAFYHAGPLPALMNNYGVQSTPMLEKFLKFVRVQTTHLPEKRNKANKVIPCVKIIFGLARKDDGHGMAHPPRVKRHGAGAEEVEFWLDGEASSVIPKVATKGGAKGRGKRKDKTQPQSSAASRRYISVFDFFEEVFCLSYLSFDIADCDAAYGRVLQYPHLLLLNCGNRSNPMYLPAEVCTVSQGQPSKAKLNSSQAQQMIRHAVRKPWEIAAAIVEEGTGIIGLDENTNVLLVRVCSYF